MGDGSWVGLDVHATSVVAGLIEEGTGELRVLRVPHRTPELVDWLAGLAAPVGWPTRPARPAFTWRAPARRPASAAWWPRRA